MIPTTYNADVARAHRQALLDRAAHSRLVRAARRPRRSDHAHRWDLPARLIRRIAATTPCSPSPCDQPPNSSPAAKSRLDVATAKSVAR
jgi:hypothetical protein